MSIFKERSASRGRRCHADSGVVTQSSKTTPKELREVIYPASKGRIARCFSDWPKCYFFSADSSSTSLGKTLPRFFFQVPVHVAAFFGGVAPS